MAFPTMPVPRTAIFIGHFLADYFTVFQERGDFPVRRSAVLVIGFFQPAERFAIQFLRGRKT